MRSRARSPSRGPRAADSPPNIAGIRAWCSDAALSGKTSPSRRKIEPRLAPLSSTAEVISVSSTVCRSKVERLMTFSTSAVAVCCCSDFAEIAGSRLHLVEQPRRSRSRSRPGRRRSAPVRSGAAGMDRPCERAITMTPTTASSRVIGTASVDRSWPALEPASAARREWLPDLGIELRILDEVGDACALLRSGSRVRRPCRGQRGSGVP